MSMTIIESTSEYMRKIAQLEHQRDTALKLGFNESAESLSTRIRDHQAFLNDLKDLNQEIEVWIKEISPNPSNHE